MEKLLWHSALILVIFNFFTTSDQTNFALLSQKKDPGQKYLFYLHGRIIEDQGVNAVSSDYGLYEYQKILETFSVAGFKVLSEARPKNTNPETYAAKLASQVDSLLKLNIAPENITIVGASKGAGITILAAEKLKNEGINFVIMGICNKDYLEYFKNNNFSLCGNLLSIYEKSDDYGSSCEMLSLASSCVKKFKEVELDLGNSHGFLYKPYKEWVIPVIEWANANQK